MRKRYLDKQEVQREAIQLKTEKLHLLPINSVSSLFLRFGVAVICALFVIPGNLYIYKGCLVALIP